MILKCNDSRSFKCRITFLTLKIGKILLQSRYRITINFKIKETLDFPFSAHFFSVTAKNTSHLNLLKLNICLIDVYKYNCISLIIHANHIQCVYTVHLVPSSYFQHCEYILACYDLHYSHYLYHMINFRFLFTTTGLLFCKLLCFHDCYRALN